MMEHATDSPEYLEMEKKAYYLSAMACADPLHHYKKYIQHLDKMLDFIEKHHQKKDA